MRHAHFLSVLTLVDVTALLGCRGEQRSVVQGWQVVLEAGTALTFTTSEAVAVRL